MMSNTYYSAEVTNPVTGETVTLTDATDDGLTEQIDGYLASAFPEPLPETESDSLQK